MPDQEGLVSVFKKRSQPLLCISSLMLYFVYKINRVEFPRISGNPVSREITLTVAGDEQAVMTRLRQIPN